MSLISDKFADELTEKEMRDAYLSAQTRTKIVEQIRAIRAQRGWSQAEFARQLDKPQSNVSQRLENRDYGGFTLNTLLEVASTFDVGLVVKFVPYAEFICDTDDLRADALAVAPFLRASLDSLCRDTNIHPSPEPLSSEIWPGHNITMAPRPLEPVGGFFNSGIEVGAAPIDEPAAISSATVATSGAMFLKTDLFLFGEKSRRAEAASRGHNTPPQGAPLGTPIGITPGGPQHAPMSIQQMAAHQPNIATPTMPRFWGGSL